MQDIVGNYARSKTITTSSDDNYPDTIWLDAGADNLYIKLLTCSRFAKSYDFINMSGG